MRRSTFRILLATACVAALTMVVLALPAGAQQFAAPLTVTKVVEGDVPADATFVITLTCSGAIITDGLGGESVAQYTFEWGAEGGEQTVGFSGPGECTVAETADGGATETVYECVAIDTDCRTFAENVEVDVISEGQTVDVTVTNVFDSTPDPDPEPEPEAPLPAVVTPRFTG